MDRVLEMLSVSKYERQNSPLIDLLEMIEKPNLTLTNSLVVLSRSLDQNGCLYMELVETTRVKPLIIVAGCTER